MSVIDSLNRFVKNPTNLDMGRSKFPRNFTHKTTFKSGDLVDEFFLGVLYRIPCGVRNVKLLCEVVLKLFPHVLDLLTSISFQIILHKNLIRRLAVSLCFSIRKYISLFCTFHKNKKGILFPNLHLQRLIVIAPISMI